MLFYVVKYALLPCKSCSFTSENMPFSFAVYTLLIPECNAGRYGMLYIIMSK